MKILIKKNILYSILYLSLHVFRTYAPNNDDLLWSSYVYDTVILTLKHRERHGCVVSTMATDALVLKHQAISIHNAN